MPTARTSTRTPNIVAIEPGEDIPEPATETALSPTQVYTSGGKNSHAMLRCVCTQVNADFGRGGSQTDVIGQRHIYAVDARVVEEVAQHQLTLFGGLYHVAGRVNWPHALGVQNHTAHLFGQAGDKRFKLRE